MVLPLLNPHADEEFFSWVRDFLKGPSVAGDTVAEVFFVAELEKGVGVDPGLHVA